MPTISLCMIVKNEEMHIARCLDSVAGLVEEIIIADTGSADRTDRHPGTERLPGRRRPCLFKGVQAEQ